MVVDENDVEFYAKTTTTTKSLLDGNNNGTTDEEYHLSEDEARELFGEYVSRKSCFTRAPPLKSLVFKSLRTSNIYKVIT